MARIVVAMSGGVDSSVAAALLKEQGYDVVGIMLRLWSEPTGESGEEQRGTLENKCCSIESMGDARRVAARLDIPFYVVNVEQPFQEHIVDYFYDEYLAGRTPNPCLRCNRHIRFTLLLERALALGADYLATGHYVRVDDDPVTGLRRIRRGISAEKDQSYVLHVLGQGQLRHALFPLGGYHQAGGAGAGCRARLAGGDQGREPGDLLRGQRRLPWLYPALRRKQGAAAAAGWTHSR